MIGLTRKQSELLTYIETYMAMEPIAPSFEEMTQAIGLKSKSGIHRLLAQLEDRGHIRRRKYSARTIEIVRGEDLSRFMSTTLVDELKRRGYSVHVNPEPLRRVA